MTNKQIEIIEQLRQIFESKEFDNIKEEAIRQNEWFTRHTIDSAVRAICSQMLEMNKVSNWINSYQIPQLFTPRKVAIVMAGNIPLVGFFDLLCTLLVGHRAVIKPSSKDTPLMSHIAQAFSEVEITNRITQADMIIATGGQSAAEHYTQNFDNIPSIIRSNRHSVAILTGNENEQQIRQALTEDMFLYWGLGCRNVNHLYLPLGYDLKKLPEPTFDFQPLNDCYRYQKARMTMAGQPFIDKGTYLLTPASQTPPPLSTINYTYYNRIDEIKLPLEQIQCIVGGKDLKLPHTIPFGQSQYPQLNDYADGEDVINFLINS